jgi:hypothetical protein
MSRFAAIGDLNDDGKPDLVVTNYGSLVNVLLNNTPDVPRSGVPRLAYCRLRRHSTYAAPPATRVTRPAPLSRGRSWIAKPVMKIAEARKSRPLTGQPRARWGALRVGLAHAQHERGQHRRAGADGEREADLDQCD